jgi:hypothetical protein
MTHELVPHSLHVHSSTRRLHAGQLPPSASNCSNLRASPATNRMQAPPSFEAYRPAALVTIG